MTGLGLISWRRFLLVLILLIYAYLWLAALIALFVANLGQSWSDFDAHLVVLANALPLVKTLFHELDEGNLTFVVVGGVSTLIASIALVDSIGKRFPR